MAAVTRAANALKAYFTAYPKGSYGASARGLVRRTLWLTGNMPLLAREYSRMLGDAPVGAEAAAALVEEIDNKLLTQVGSAEGIEDPLLVATLDLMAMRNATMKASTRSKARNAFAPPSWRTAAVFRFAARSASLLSANHAYYVSGDMKRVLALVPDDAKQAAPMALSPSAASICAAWRWPR